MNQNIVSQDELNTVTEQLQAVLLSKPFETENTENPALKELNLALMYLAICMEETNGFLKELCKGNLAAEPPRRHNFIAGHLKELHSILKHLTWQTAQVAAGDYSQKVRFLGEFSDSFNLMIEQLHEREVALKAKTQALAKSMNLLRSILDAQQEWVIVMDSETRAIIYVNRSAKNKFFNMETGMAACYDYEGVMALLSQSQHPPEEQEYSCLEQNMQLLIRSYPIEWEGRQAYVHTISDVTDEHEEIEFLQDMAYRDALTDAYNRRYCIERLDKLLHRGQMFTLILFDLDGLKNVNDTLGHNYGDDYIITVVKTVIASCRADDIMCRIGGDEFVLILPNCSEQAAQKKMDSMIADLNNIHKQYSIMLSYGILNVQEKSMAAPEELISLADIKMYSMKQQHKQHG